VHSKTHKGPQQPGEKKGKGKKVGGVIIKKMIRMLRGKKMKKGKVKLPCKICGDDHITHHCPQMEESQCLMNLKQQQ
jgi:hypothetical protein